MKFRPVSGLFGLALLPVLHGCTDPPASEAKDQENARLLADMRPAAAWQSAEGARPVLLYVDRSQSMRGFLDPGYPTRVATDYRSVIDAFDASLSPQQVFGFGNRVEAAPESGLKILGNQRFYTDGNTEMEQVADRILADTGEAFTHVIVGDGRRSSPDVANGQYVRLRAVADRWIARGGTFMLAASMAPFHPVTQDPSACRADGSAAEGHAGAAPAPSGGRVCPLYAFAFVAPGQSARVAATLARSFEHLFVTPLPAVRGATLAVAKQGDAGPTLEPRWTRAQDSTPIIRVRADSALNTPVRAAVALQDTSSLDGRAQWTALRSQGLVPRLWVRPLRDTAVGWTASSAKGLVRTGGDPFVLEFFSRGPENEPYLYRVELRPTGVPAWLGDFDAEAAGDPLRTFGLGRLFEGFRVSVPDRAPPALTFYAVVN